MCRLPKHSVLMFNRSVKVDVSIRQTANSISETLESFNDYRGFYDSL